MSFSKNVAEVENYDGKKGAKIESKKQTKLDVVLTKIENRGTMTWQEKLLSFNEICGITVTLMYGNSSETHYS